MFPEAMPFAASDSLHESPLTDTTILSITDCGCAAKGSNTVTCKGRIMIRALFYGCKLPARSRGVGMLTTSSSVSTTTILWSVKASRNTFLSEIDLGTCPRRGNTSRATNTICHLSGFAMVPLQRHRAGSTLDRQR